MVIAGEKCQAAPFPWAAACTTRPCKRPSGVAATMEEWRDWASLHPDLMDLIASRVLAADLVDYISLRAVCAPWRRWVRSPRDPILRDARFRPRGWVALCDGDGVRPADACEVAFLNTATGRCLRARLPELRGHRIVDFTDGLLILLNKDTTDVRVLHPFTRVAVDFPPRDTVFTNMVKDQESRTWMRATVCTSQTSIAVVAWFLTVPGVVVAEPFFADWYPLHHDSQFAAVVTFQGRVYGVVSRKRQVLQVYPQCPNPCVAQIPNKFGVPRTNRFSLVESATRLMLVLRHYIDYRPGMPWTPCGFALFEVDTAGHTGLTSVSNIGDKALFLGSDRSHSISRSNLPSICGNAIYFCLGDFDPVAVYSISNVASERTSTFSVIRDHRM